MSDEEIEYWLDSSFVLQHIKTEEQRQELQEILVDFENYINQ